MVAFVAFTRHIPFMPVAPRHPSGKKPLPSAVPALERSAAARVASLLSPATAKSRSGLQVVDAKGHRLELPARLADVMYRAAELLAEGRAVAVLPDEEMLMALPPRLLEPAIDGLRALAANGLRYPIPPYGIQNDVRAGMGVSYASKK